jgi:uncharacterized protein
LRSVDVFKEGSGERVAANVEVATSIWARFWGLMFRGGLDEESALLIDPCSSIHTIFMRFPIDAVFIDSENFVTKVVPCLKPYRAALGRKRSRKVLEMPCGAAEAASISPGDQLSFRAD